MYIRMYNRRSSYDRCCGGRRWFHWNHPVRPRVLFHDSGLSNGGRHDRSTFLLPTPRTILDSHCLRDSLDSCVSCCGYRRLDVGAICTCSLIGTRSVLPLAPQRVIHKFERVATTSSGTIARRWMFPHGGRRRCPMRRIPRLLDKPDRDFTAYQTVNSIAEILFASPPLGLEELFNDPKVHKRVGEIISVAASRPIKRSRRVLQRGTRR